MFRPKSRAQLDAETKAAYAELRAGLLAAGEYERAARLPEWNAPAPLHPDRQRICLELFGCVPDLPVSRTYAEVARGK